MRRIKKTKKLVIIRDERGTIEKKICTHGGELKKKNGGRYWARTSDLRRVKTAL